MLFSEESQKATQFIQLANRADTPLLFLQNTTGYMVGKEYEQGGIIKHGAMMINAVTNSTVPHLTVTLGASYGAGNYGMCGRAYGPRFLFSLAERQVGGDGPAAARRRAVDRRPAGGRSTRRGLRRGRRRGDARRGRGQIESESDALVMSGMLYDDGIIDPRDTRTVLGIALSRAAHTQRSVSDGRPQRLRRRSGIVMRVQ